MNHSVRLIAEDIRALVLDQFPDMAGVFEESEEMSRPVHIMLDLETWGTEPGYDLRSIGACVFDPDEGYVGSGQGHLFYIATDNPTGYWGKGSANCRFFKLPEKRCHRRKYQLQRDPATVKWWSEQSEEAQVAFADPVDLKTALTRFTTWLDNVTRDPVVIEPLEKRLNVRLWSHGPAFDPPILAAAYKACNLPIPWHHRTPRDTRTCFDMACIDDHSAWLNAHPGPLGVPHHALDDAICQARAVCGAYRRVGPTAPATPNYAALGIDGPEGMN